MSTEITDIKNENGWIFFDGQCQLCLGFARRWAPLLSRHHFQLAPLQTPWVRERLELSDDELLKEMRLLTPQGSLYGGADALVAIARQIWWAWPFYCVAQVPFVKAALRHCYAWLARRRNCLGGSCQSGIDFNEPGFTWLKWIPAILLPFFTATQAHDLPGWVLMWLMAFTVFIAAKWVTAFPLLISRKRINRIRLLEYLVFWPGMDPRAFCGKDVVPVPSKREWTIAGAKTFFGAALIWCGVRSIRSNEPLLIGWAGMIGVIFLLHFGIFHLLSLYWRARGINAKPMMRSPGTVTSLAKFWGGNWNAAFSDLMRDQIFKPLAETIGTGGAMFAVFLVSGILHELVISFPAHGGYGLPTLYFAIQGAGVFLERSRLGRYLGLGHGWRGWCFVFLIAGIPAFWLFHPTFVRNVILPMLNAIGAT